MKSEKNWNEYLTSRSFTDGYIPDYHVDAHGAVKGISFEMQRVEKGMVHRLKDPPDRVPSG